MPRARLNPELMVLTSAPDDRALTTQARRRASAENGLLGGRPTSFKVAMIKTVYNLSLLGCTDQQIAVALDITTQTFHQWKRDNARFSYALRAGKDEADGKVARKIYQQACEGSLPHQRWWMAVRRRGEWPLVDDKSGLTVNVNAMPDATFAYTDTRDASVAYRAFMAGEPLPQLPSRVIEHVPDENEE